MPRILRPSVENLRGLGNFTQGFRWGIVHTPPPGLGLNSEGLNFRAVSCGIPEWSTETMEIQIREFKSKQPGMTSIASPVPFEFFETEDNFVHDYFNKWKKLVVDTKKGYVIGSKSSYMTTMIVYRLNSMDEPIWKYELGGVYPESVSKGNLDAQSGEPLSMSTNLAFNFFDDGPP